jgi:hypothetical protein
LASKVASGTRSTLMAAFEHERLFNRQQHELIQAHINSLIRETQVPMRRPKAVAASRVPASDGY